MDERQKLTEEETRLQLEALTEINDWQLADIQLLHARVGFNGRKRDFCRSELTFRYERPITLDFMRTINTNTIMTIIVPTPRGDIKIYGIMSEIKKNSFFAQMIIDVCSVVLPPGVSTVPLRMANTYSLVFEPEVQDWDIGISRVKLPFAKRYETVPDEELNMVHNLVPKNSVYKGSDVQFTKKSYPPEVPTFWKKFERRLIWSDELQAYVCTTQTQPTSRPFMLQQRPKKNQKGILPKPTAIPQSSTVHTRVVRPANEQKKARKPPIELLNAIAQNMGAGNTPSSPGVFKAPIGPAPKKKNRNGQATSGPSGKLGASKQQHGKNSNDDDCIVIEEVNKQRNAFEEGEIITLDNDDSPTETKKSANAAKKARRKQRKWEAQRAILESLKSNLSNFESVIPVEIDFEEVPNAGSEDREVVQPVKENEKNQKVAEQLEGINYTEWGTVGNSVSATNPLFGLGVFSDLNRSGSSTSGLQTGWPFLSGTGNNLITNDTPTEISNKFDNLSLSKGKGKLLDRGRQSYEPLYTTRRPSDATSDDTDFPGFVDFSKPREEMQTPKTPQFDSVPDWNTKQHDSTRVDDFKNPIIKPKTDKQGKMIGGNLTQDETNSEKKAKSGDKSSQSSSADTKTQSSSLGSVSKPESVASTESLSNISRQESMKTAEQQVTSTGDVTPDETLLGLEQCDSSSKYSSTHREEQALPGDIDDSSSAIQKLLPQSAQSQSMSESRPISTGSQSESSEKKRRVSVVDVPRKQSSGSTDLQETRKRSSVSVSSLKTEEERRDDSLERSDRSSNDFDPSSFWTPKATQSSSSASHSDFMRSRRKSSDCKSTTSSEVSSTSLVPPPPIPLVSPHSSRGHSESKRTKRSHDESEERPRSDTFTTTSDKQSEESLKRAEFKSIVDTEMNNSKLRNSEKVADYTGFIKNLVNSGKSLTDILNYIVDEENNTFYTSHDVMDKMFVDKIFKMFHATMLTMDEDYGPRRKGETGRKLSGEIKDWSTVRFITHVSEIVDTFSSSDNFLQVMQNEAFVNSLEKFFALIKEKSSDIMRRKNQRHDKEREQARLKREQEERKQQELKQLERRHEDDEPQSFGNRQRKESGHKRRWF